MQFSYGFLIDDLAALLLPFFHFSPEAAEVTYFISKAARRVFVLTFHSSSVNLVVASFFFFSWPLFHHLSLFSICSVILGRCRVPGIREAGAQNYNFGHT